MGQIRLLTSISTAEMKLQKKYDNLLKIHHVPVLGHHIILCFLQKYIKVEKFHEKKRNFIKCAADDIGKKTSFSLKRNSFCHVFDDVFSSRLLWDFHFPECALYSPRCLYSRFIRIFFFMCWIYEFTLDVHTKYFLYWISSSLLGIIFLFHVEFSLKTCSAVENRQLRHLQTTTYKVHSRKTFTLQWMNNVFSLVQNNFSKSFYFFLKSHSIFSLSLFFSTLTIRNSIFSLCLAQSTSDFLVSIFVASNYQK